MQNPFRYGAKVSGGSFYDRREIKASIINVIDGSCRLVVQLFDNHLRRGVCKTTPLCAIA